jgi:hypothetical protein
VADPIDLLLVEAGMSDDAELRALLADFERELTSVRPMPSAELAALMVPVRSPAAVRRRGGVITALVVIGTLGAGATAAAASPAVRDAAHQVFQAVTGAVLPGTTVPGPDQKGGPGVAPTHSNPASPHPGATDHPGPGDHPGNGATHAATPDPGGSHSPKPGGGHPTADPIPGDPGNGHKP